MAIAYYSSTTAGVVGSASSYTFAADSGSGSNRLLIVFAAWDSSVSVTSVTYNGVGMTHSGTDATASAEGGRKMGIYYLVNPSTGSNNVVISTSGTSSIIAGGALAYTGCKQTGQPDGSSHADQNTSNPANLTVTTAADNCWGVYCVRTFSSGTSSAGTGTTARGTGGYMQTYDSGGPKTPAGSLTLSAVPGSGGEPHFEAMLTFSPVASANGNFLAFM